MTTESALTNSPLLQNRPVFFLHVTKCGGTSMRMAVRRALVETGVHPSEMYELNAPQTTELAKRASLDSFALRDLLLSSQLANKNSGLIAGHFRFTDEYHGDLLKNFTAMTVLREPVDRFLSLFYYNSFKETEYGKETLPLEEYIARPKARRCAEDYVRIFRGTGVSHSSFAMKDDIKNAIANLAKFDVVGRLENMQGFITDFYRSSGLMVEPDILNKSPAPAAERFARLPTELMDEIQRLCEPSTVVYQSVSKLK